MKVFQYWDTGELPDDVAACIRGSVEMNPGLPHRLFSRASGAHFIATHIGERERDAFLSLAVPAMQADYLRLAVLWAKGGIWNDVDNLSLQPFASLIEAAPGGYVSMLDRLLQTDLLIVPRKRSPFFRACLELATRHVESRMEGGAYDVTGPRVLNLIWAAIDPVGAHDDWHRARDPNFATTSAAIDVAALYPGAADAFARMERRHDIWTNQWIKTAIPAYKASPADWRRWDRPSYVDAQQAEFV